MTTIDGYDLDTINIVLYNNIDRNKPIDLDNKMFMFEQPIKSDNGKMWICTNVRYSEEVLMTKTHAECVQVFFDQALFLKYIKESSIKKPKNTPDDMKKHAADMWENSENNKKCKLTHNCFMKENMLILIKYCFPATFPVSNPPFSFSSGQKNVITFTSYINSWFNVDKYANFTHMKIDGKEATVIGCQWLDTVKFHPAYQKVNKGIKQYFAKLKKPLSDLLKQVIDLMNKIIFSAYDVYDFLKQTLLHISNKPNLEQFIKGELLKYHNIIKQTLADLTIKINKIDNTVLHDLFNFIYFIYYAIRNENTAVENATKSTKNAENADEVTVYHTLLELMQKDSVLKQIKLKLDLILLLCCVSSKEIYNRIIRDDLGINQVTLQKYDFHKPLITTFESITLPIRQSTNDNINKLFGLDDFPAIPGLYNVYGENGFYDVANDKTQDTYIGIDRINLSADKKKAPHYEIYLAMEFVGGRVDDNNRSAISCLFENNRLGRLLEKNIKKEKESDDILEMREYIDLTEIIKKTEKEIKQKEAQEAKEAKAAKVAKEANTAKENAVREAQAVAPQNQGSNDNLLQLELDKLPGVTGDIQKKIVDKINKSIPAVKELAETISKYNKEGSIFKPAYDKILTKAKSDIQSLIKTATYDIKENPNLPGAELDKAKYDLEDYKKIKELIIQLIDQAFFENDKEKAKKFSDDNEMSKVKGGSYYKTRSKRRRRQRNRKTRKC
jgi:predicted amino acid-binding ACT domain protein